MVSFTDAVKNVHGKNKKVAHKALPSVSDEHMVTSPNISSWNEHGNVEPHCFIYDEEANFCKWWSHLCLCSPTDGKKQPIEMLII